MHGGDEGEENADQAFVLRLPNSIADKVRGMISGDKVPGLNLKVDMASTSSQFKGRQATLNLKGDQPQQLPASVLEVPTLLEAYRVIDGRSGDYIKCCEVSQIVVVHENAAEAEAVRTSRPSGRMNSGITPPTHKIMREFAKAKPHLTQLKKLKKTKPTAAVKRGESHICRINNKGDGDIELEEVEIECESPLHNQMDDREELGGGLPYKGKDGNMYYQKNNRCYRLNTNERVGFLATKVKFMQAVPQQGLITVCYCEMPRRLRVPENARAAEDDEEFDAAEEAGIDREMQGQSVPQADTDLVNNLNAMLDDELDEEGDAGEETVQGVDGDNAAAQMEDENMFGEGSGPAEGGPVEFGAEEVTMDEPYDEEQLRDQDEPVSATTSQQNLEPNQSFVYPDSETGTQFMDSEGLVEPDVMGPEEGMMTEPQEFADYDEQEQAEGMNAEMDDEFVDPEADAVVSEDPVRLELEAKVTELEQRYAALDEALEKEVQKMKNLPNPVLKKRMQPQVDKAQAERDAAYAELEEARAELNK